MVKLDMVALSRDVTAACVILDIFNYQREKQTSELSFKPARLNHEIVKFPYNGETYDA